MRYPLKNKRRGQSSPNQHIYRQRRLIILYVGLFILIALSLFSGNCKLPTVEPESDASGLSPFQRSLVAQLNNTIHPLPTAPLGISDYQLSVLDFLGKSQIVGLGEATRGTKEFFEMKHRVFRFLVEHHGFRVLGFETGFAESLCFDRYITTGQGDLRQLMKDNMQYWTWETEEVFRLLEWMRQYNETKARNEMIRFLGFDCPRLDLHGTMLITYLQAVSPQYLSNVRSILNHMATLGEEVYKKMTEEEFFQLAGQLQQVYDRFFAKEKEFVAISGRQEYEIAKQLIRTAIQSHAVLYMAANQVTSPNLRSEYMAENALWMSDFLSIANRRPKIVLSGHNAHLANGSSAYMGFYLREHLGCLYKIVGFSFSTGSFNARVWNPVSRSFGRQDRCEAIGPPQDNSINFIFHYANYDQFIFVLEDIDHDSPLENWMSTPQEFMNVRAGWTGIEKDYYHDETVAHYYDAIIHFDITNATEKLG